MKLNHSLLATLFSLAFVPSAWAQIPNGPITGTPNTWTGLQTFLTGINVGLDTPSTALLTVSPLNTPIQPPDLNTIAQFAAGNGTNWTAH